MQLGKSWMKTVNSKGPKILPCGTPEMTGNTPEKFVYFHTLISIIEVHFKPMPEITSDSNCPQFMQ